jgi:hypothetical protein
LFKFLDDDVLLHLRLCTTAHKNNMEYAVRKYPEFRYSGLAPKDAGFRRHGIRAARSPDQ